MRDLPNDSLSDTERLLLAGDLIGHLHGLSLVEAENVLERARLVLKQTHVVDVVSASEQIRSFLKGQA